MPLKSQTHTWLTLCSECIDVFCFQKGETLAHL